SIHNRRENYMVSSSILKQLSELVELAKRINVYPHNLTGILADVVFEITTLDPFMVGLASKIVSGGKLTKADKQLLEKGRLDERNYWLREDGTWIDISHYPALLKSVDLLEEMRRLCKQFVHGISYE